MHFWGNFSINNAACNNFFLIPDLVLASCSPVPPNSIVVKGCTGGCHTTLHYTTLHYTTLHYTTLHYTTPHWPRARSWASCLWILTMKDHLLSIIGQMGHTDVAPWLHYTTLQCSVLHNTTLHYSVVCYTTLHYTSLHYTTLHYTTLHYTTLHYTTLHYTTLHHTTLLPG